MSSFNKVILMGNLTRDPQTKHLPGNSVVAEFGLACNRRYRSAAGEDREETAFIDCAAFGRQAEVIGQFCRKGKLLFVEGRLKYDTWDDKQSGAKRSKLSVVVENFQFIGGRDEAASGTGPGSPGSDVFGQQHRSPRNPDGNERSSSSGSSGGGGGKQMAESPGRKSRSRTAQLPFAKDAQFEEADIPF